MSARPIQLEQLGAIAGVFAGYRYKNVIITFWFDAPTMEGLSRVEQGSRELCALHPGGFSVVTMMVPGGRSMPSAEVRARFGEIAASQADLIAGAAVLIPGSGFWAGAIRGLVTAITLLARPKYELAVFGSLEAVAEWLAPIHSLRTPVVMDEQELLTALRVAQALSAAERSR